MSLPERAPSPSPARSALSWLWAWSPLLTFGVGTAPAMIGAALYKRSPKLGVAAVVYLIAMVTALVTAQESILPDSVVFNVAVLFNVFGGLIHGLAARRRVFDIPEDTYNPTPDEVEVLSAQRAALAAHRAAGTARKTARELVESSPIEALRMRVGRIDITRRDYPDGGLIDMNNVSGKVLVKALGLDEEAGQRLLRARDASGGFSSAEEASVLANLPPRALEANAELLIFLPRR